MMGKDLFVRKKKRKEVVEKLCWQNGFLVALDLRLLNNCDY